MPELLAPAGEPDAGYAALHYGADAVYLGLNRFSARAEAVNFRPDELAEFVAYAHSLSKRRQVFLALNTLVKERELADAAATLFEAAECGVDAVIVQDWGVVGLIKKHFPSLALHASTQMAIHNLEGALAAKRLGFRRVTLARELTLAEVENIVKNVGPELEVETFIHGTLCYSYSGLCLFSSVRTGRSGNRGRCVYSCREAADTPAGRAHPFSLKDMAQGERVLDLVRAGVASLKIEGRKKSPLYVAATVDYYRRLLDGKMAPGEAAECEARLKTIFARPWTKLFLDSKRNPEAADPLVVGHRGSEIGRIEKIVRTPAGRGIRFVSSLPVERHDGLQVDVPGQPRPFGFPVDNLYRIKGGGTGGMESVFEAPAGAALAVALPADAPELSPGLPLYLSSSQAVKRSYGFVRPKQGAFLPRLPVAFDITVREPSPTADGEAGAAVVCVARADAPAPWRGIDAAFGGEPIASRLECVMRAFPARDADGAEQAARKAFERLGEYPFALAGWSFSNPHNLFIPPGDWNRLRRDVMDALRTRCETSRDEVRRRLIAPLQPPSPAPITEREQFRWNVVVGEPAVLSAFGPDDFAVADEVAVGIGDGDAASIGAALERLAETVGRNKLRLALPLIMRDHQAAAMAEKTRALLAAGWRRWLVPGLAGLQLLSAGADLDLTADWTLYCLNSLAANELSGMGFASFTLSPEDDAGNLADALARPGLADRAWLPVYMHPPLFISAACAHAHIGLCKSGPGHKGCPIRGKGMKIRLERSGEAEILPQTCGSVVVGNEPYCLSDRLDAIARLGAKRLGVDFRWKKPSAEAAVQIWRNVVSGNGLQSISGNFERGLV